LEGGAPRQSSSLRTSFFSVSPLRRSLPWFNSLKICPQRPGAATRLSTTKERRNGGETWGKKLEGGATRQTSFLTIPILRSPVAAPGSERSTHRCLPGQAPSPACRGTPRGLPLPPDIGCRPSTGRSALLRSFVGPHGPVVNLSKNRPTSVARQFSITCPPVTGTAWPVSYSCSTM